MRIGPFELPSTESQEPTPRIKGYVEKAKGRAYDLLNAGNFRGALNSLEESMKNDPKRQSYDQQDHLEMMFTTLRNTPDLEEADVRRIITGFNEL